MGKIKNFFKIDQNIFVLGITSFFNDFSSEMIFSIFPAFFSSVLKTGAASLGFVEGITDATSNFIKILSGKYSDKIQKRKIFVIIGYAISTATRPFYIIAGNIGSVFSLRFSDRIGKGLRDAPRDSLISLSSAKENYGKSFGFHRAMDTMGGILGPLAAYFILKRNPEGFNSIFIISFLVGILALVSLFFIKEIKNIFQDGIRVNLQENFSLKFKMYIFSVSILALGTIPVAILLLKTQDIGLILASIPLYYMVYNISYSLFSFVSGKLADVFGSIKIIILGYAFLIIGYFFLYNSTTSLRLFVSFFLIGIFSAFIDGNQRSYLAHITEEKKRGSAYGILNGVSGIGVLIAGIGNGLLWQKAGSNLTLIISSFVVIIGVALLFFSQKVKPGVESK